MFTTRPTIPSPTLIDAIRWVRFTVAPSLTSLEGPKSTTPTLSYSTSSPYCALERP